VRENWNLDDTVEPSSTPLAAKQLKDAAHGASSGEKPETGKLQAGRKKSSHPHTGAKDELSSDYEAGQNDKLPTRGRDVNTANHTPDSGFAAAFYSCFAT